MDAPNLPPASISPPSRADGPLESRPGRRFLRAPSTSIYETPGAESARARDRRFRRALVVADGLAAALALFVGVAVLGDDALKPAAALFVPLVIVVSKIIGLYDRDELLLRKATLDDVPALLHLTTAYTLLAWVMSPVVISGTLGRGQALGLWSLLLLAGVGARWVAREFARRTAAVERCLLVGDDDAQRRLTVQLAEGSAVRAEIVEHVPLAETDVDTILGRIEQAIRFGDVHRVILAPRALDSDEVLDAVQLAKALGAKVSLLPRVFEVVGSSVEFDDLGGMTILGLRRFGLTRSSWLLKRAFDRVGARS